MSKTALFLTLLALAMGESFVLEAEWGQCAT
jgi:hypothetical protein